MPTTTTTETDNAGPKCCPVCGSSNFVQCVEWFARSTDPQDSQNTALLTEYQCLNDGCALSFWL
jgi:hypothetical protein